MDDRYFPEDIVAQGSEPGWRPSRAAGILAVVALLAGLAAGYAIGSRPGGRARTASVATAPRSAASSASPGPVLFGLPGPAVTQEPGTCSMQAGKDLELGIPVTNMSAETVLLRSARPAAGVPGQLRVLSWHWAPCGFDADGIIIPGSVALGAGETTWLTATVRPLVGCPAAAPLQFRVTYSVNGQRSSVTLPGFADLGAVRYSGCQGH